MSPPPGDLASVIEVATVKVNGTALRTAVIADLLDVRVDLVINGVSEATLRLYDADFAKTDAPTFDIGDEVEIGFGLSSRAATTVFSGEVTAIAIEQGPTNLHELVVTCFDKGHRLARSTEAKTYQQVTYGDVARQIAGAHGLSSEIASAFGSATHPYLLQTTDDAAFLAELVRRVGNQWRVDGDTLKVFDGFEGLPTATMEWGETLLRFRARVNGAPALDEVGTRGWDPLTKREIQGRAGNPNAGTLSSISELAQLRSKGKSIGGSAPKRVGTRQVFTSVEEANTAATALRQEIAASVLQAKGMCFGTPALQPGTKIEIKGVGTRMSGTYFLTAVEHVVRPRRVLHPLHRRADHRLRRQRPARQRRPADDAPGTGDRHRHEQQGHPDRPRGRRPREVPDLRREHRERLGAVVSLGAGATRGMLMLPAVNDEVLVVFEGGDYRRPLVIGGIWNGRTLRSSLRRRPRRTVMSCSGRSPPPRGSSCCSTTRRTRR